MESKQLGYVITESPFITTDPKIIKENAFNRRVTAEVILQDMDALNRNKRFYASKQMKPALKADRLTELVNTGNLYSEEGHPQSKEISRQTIIDPTLRCCLIEKFWVEGSDIKAHVHGSNLPYGEAFNQDLLDGSKPSFSLRAIGTLNNTSRGAEVENITIITWDRVVFPSHKKAYTKKLINLSENASIEEAKSLLESVENAGNKLIVSENYAGNLIPIYNEQMLDYIKEKSKNYNQIKESCDLLYESTQLSEDGRQIQLTAKDGDIFVINLEEQIYNNIFDYSAKNIIL